MTNVFFKDEEITENDLYFLCYMVERLARRLHQHNRYVVNQIAPEEWRRLISLANVLHCENPSKLESEWIEEYHLQDGNFDIMNIDPELVDEVPSPTQMGKVYMRLILATIQPGEDYVDGMYRVYNDELCETIDNYNTISYNEPTYVIAKAKKEGEY